MPAPGEVDIVLAAELMEAGALDPARPGHARPLDADRLDASALLRSPRRKSRATPSPIPNVVVRGGRRRRQAHHRLRHGDAGDQEQQRDLGVPVRRAGRIRHAAVRPREASKASSAPAAAASSRASTPSAPRYAQAKAAARARSARRSSGRASASTPCPPPPAAPISTCCWRASANSRSRCTPCSLPASSGSPIFRIRPMPANISIGSPTLYQLDQRQWRRAKDYALTATAAKYVAVAMAYDDVIRVADLKTRASRYERVLRENSVGDGSDRLHHRIHASAAGGGRRHHAGGARAFPGSQPGACSAGRSTAAAACARARSTGS